MFLKAVVFWDIVSFRLICSSGRSSPKILVGSVLKMEALRFTETSVNVLVYRALHPRRLETSENRLQNFRLEVARKLPGRKTKNVHVTKADWEHVNLTALLHVRQL